MIAVTYEKTFLSGALRGMTLPISVPYPDEASAHRAAERLSRITRKKPSQEAGSSSLFYVDGVQVSL